MNTCSAIGQCTLLVTTSISLEFLILRPQTLRLNLMTRSKRNIL
jgi:hypothetical protein